MARVMISLPDDLLNRIDDEAARRQSSRSALLQEAVRRELGWPDPDALDAAVATAREVLANAGSFESGTLVRAERDALHAGS